MHLRSSARRSIAAIASVCALLLGGGPLLAPPVARASIDPASRWYFAAPGRVIDLPAPGLLAGSPRPAGSDGVKLVGGLCRHDNEDAPGHEPRVGPCRDVGDTIVVNRDGSFTATQGTGSVNGNRRFIWCHVDAANECIPSEIWAGFVSWVAPTAVDDGYQTAAGTELTIDVGDGVIWNDVDTTSNLEELVITPSFVVDLPAHGTLAYPGDGSFRYAPHVGFSGPDQFSYCIGRSSTCDSNVALVTIDVAPLPFDPSVVPVAVDDAYSATSGALRVPAPGVAGNDHRGLGTALIHLDGPEHGTVELDDDGSLTYTPRDPSFVGDDGFTYCWKPIVDLVGGADGCGSNEATVRIRVAGLARPGEGDAVAVAPAVPGPTVLTAPVAVEAATATGGQELARTGPSNGPFTALAIALLAIGGNLVAHSRHRGRAD